MAGSAPAAARPLVAKPLTLFQRVTIWLLTLTDRVYPWYKWPVLPALLYLDLRRICLRVNLVDVPQPADSDLAKRIAKQPTVPDAELLPYRAEDGWANDGKNPGAGALGATIGRNMAPVRQDKRIVPDDVSPQLIAQKLLARREFQPAGMQLNVMAASWIQAMIHDWQDHELHATERRVIGDDNNAYGCPMAKFAFRKTLDGAPDGDSAYFNRRTGWWDASFVYGQSPEAVSRAREFTGGRIKLNSDGMLPLKGDGACEVGDQHNSWAGVGVLQALFAAEHNAIADDIAAADPSLDDDRIFQLARLAVSAIVAKVHTTDWTVELLKTPTLDVAMHTNWYGVVNALFHVNEGPTGPTFLGLVAAKEPRNHGVQFSLTEEFTAVYRLHSLLPDYMPLERAGATPEHVPMEKLFGRDGMLALQKTGVAPFLSALLRYPCGALTLNNYPRSLRSLPTTDDSGVPIDETVDLAALDIFRDRERGIQKYNEFRRRLNLNAVKDFRELTGGDARATAALEDVYGKNGIENCDLMVGNLAEKRIPGFAISETQFVVFLLMASRRLESDRFLTKDFNETVYGKVGFARVQQVKGLRDIIKRHYPQIEATLPPKQSAFTPWSAWPTAANTV